MSTSDWASQSGHFYDAITGEPRYTIVGKNGKERPTTLADARKHGYVPGVTTIIKCASSYGLERWKAEQLLHAGLTLPHLDGESEPDWIARVWQDSQEQSRQAAERGTEIHAAIEAFYAGRNVLLREELWPWVKAADDAITGWFGPQCWLAEKSFSHALGFGGKPDLHSKSVLLDIKTKDSLDGLKLYRDHFMQLAAYAEGCAMPSDARYGIVFVSRTEPKATIIEASAEEIGRGWNMFRHLLHFWQEDNEFWPDTRRASA